MLQIKLKFEEPLSEEAMPMIVKFAELNHLTIHGGADNVYTFQTDQPISLFNLGSFMTQAVEKGDLYDYTVEAA